MAFSLIFAAALAVTNAPASFSTAVERTFPCPVIGEPAVGRRYAFTIPESGCARLELALGTDSDGDGRLADEGTRSLRLQLRSRAVRSMSATGAVRASTMLTDAR